MPTVSTIGGWRVVIYPNDHRPAHVHVVHPGTAEAVLHLRGPHGPPALRENVGFSRPALAVIRDGLQRHPAARCADWSHFHGVS